MGSIWRLGAVLVISATLGGCRFIGKNTPLEEARFRVPKTVRETQVRMQPAPPSEFPRERFRIGDQEWIVTATEYQLPDRVVRPVGTSDGLVFYALAWDEPPFDRLLAPMPQRAGTWQEFAEIY